MDIFVVKCLITVYVGVILWLNYLHLIRNACIHDAFYFNRLTPKYILFSWSRAVQYQLNEAAEEC